MFDFLWQWFSRRRKAAATPEENAASRAWLDELRRNELSVGARRIIAPEEPVKAPAIGQGSVEPETDVRQLAAAFASQTSAPRKNPTEYGEETFGSAGEDAATTGGDAAAEGGDGGAFGGSGGSDSFSASSGDGGSND